jgi:hypothetical protein
MNNHMLNVLTNANNSAVNLGGSLNNVGNGVSFRMNATVKQPRYKRRPLGKPVRTRKQRKNISRYRKDVR